MKVWLIGQFDALPDRLADLEVEVRSFRWLSPAMATSECPSLCVVHTTVPFSEASPMGATSFDFCCTLRARCPDARIWLVTRHAPNLSEHEAAEVGIDRFLEFAPTAEEVMSQLHEEPARK